MKRKQGETGKRRARKPAAKRKPQAVAVNGRGRASTVADQLRAAIAEAEQQGVTRYQIAKRAGLAKTVVNRFADGTTIPRLDIAERIAGILGLRLVAQKLP